MTTITIGMLTVSAMLMIPIITALFKLYGDIRVLRSNDTKYAEYVVDSEKARHSVVTAVAGIKKDIEYIKKDAESNSEFRSLVYEAMLNNTKIKQA